MVISSSNSYSKSNSDVVKISTSNKLNLKKFDLKIKIKDNKRLIFDCIRNSYFHLTKEEWVRQNVIQTLINEYDIPKSKISVEKGFKINSLNKRFDIVVFNSENKIFLTKEFLFNDLMLFQFETPACQASYKSGIRFIISPLFLIK